MNNFFSVVFVSLFLTQAYAVDNDKCFEALRSFAFFSVWGGEDAFLGTNYGPLKSNRINYNGKTLLPKINTADKKSFEYRDEYGSKTLNIEYKNGKIKSIEGIKSDLSNPSSERVPAATHRLTFDNDCNLLQGTRNGDVRYDSRLCEKIKKVGINRISECNSVVNELSDAIGSFEKDLEKEGQTYIGSSPRNTNRVDKSSMDAIMTAYVSCENQLGWSKVATSSKTHGKKGKSSNGAR